MRVHAPEELRAVRALSGFDCALLEREVVRATRPGSEASRGRSPAFFVYSESGAYLLKELKRSEIPLFYGSVRSYVAYLRTHPHSLLVRLLCVLEVERDDTWLVLMHNIFRPPAGPRLSAARHEQLIPRIKFDLKGSTAARTAREPAEVLKDNNCDRTFVFPRELRERIANALVADAAWCRAQGFIDYSLVVGVSVPLRGLGRARRGVGSPGGVESSGSVCGVESASSPLAGLIEADIAEIQARAAAQGLPVFVSTRGELVYLQVIDFLTVYNGKKRAERFFKGFAVDPRTLSVQDPECYYARFKRTVLGLVVAGK